MIRIDLIIQSKSGTGKTLVYCTIILERYKLDVKAPQSLIVVPTREIALQVEAYLNNIGSNSSGIQYRYRYRYGTSYETLDAGNESILD